MKFEFLKYLIVTTLLAALMLNSCKDDNEGACSEFDFGWVKMKSTADNPYNIFVDSLLKDQIPGGGELDISLGTGNHQIRVLQVSGYSVSPTEVTRSFDVKQCETDLFEFP